MASSIQVRVEPATLQARPDGTPVQVTLHIQNTGTTVEQYRIEIVDLDQDWYTLPAGSVALMPRDQKAIQLQLHPPRERARAGTYPFTIVVSARGDHTQSTQVQAVLTVPKIGGFEADISPRRMTGRKGRYRLQLYNAGNADLSVGFEASDAEEECTYTFVPEDVELRPGKRSVVQLLVKPHRSNLIGPRKQFDFQVKVRPSGETAKTVIGQLVHVPRIRSWRPIRRTVLLFMLIGGLLTIFEALGGSSGFPTRTRPVQHAVAAFLCNKMDVLCPSPTVTPTVTPTPTLTATQTATLTVTPTATPTATTPPSPTPIPPSATPPPPAVPPTPVPPPTRVPPPPPTSIPPSATRPPAPTAILPTRTPVPPTGTPHPTASKVPTATAVPPTQTRTPAPTPSPTPRPTPTFDPGPYQPMVQTEFARGTGGVWYIGLGRAGTAQFGNGRYTMTTGGGQPFVRYPDGFEPLGSGEVQATVHLAGTGRAGVMGRWSTTVDGQVSMYALWIADDGSFGLTRWHQGSASDMFRSLPSPLVKLKGDNELVLRTQGGQLTGWINGRQVLYGDDSSALPAGNWGLYVISNLGNGSVSAQFSSVTIYRKNP